MFFEHWYLRNYNLWTVLKMFSRFRFDTKPILLEPLIFIEDMENLIHVYTHLSYFQFQIQVDPTLYIGTKPHKI